MKAETRVDQPDENSSQTAADTARRGAPQFVLLDAGGPHPGALAFSFGSLSTLLMLFVVLLRPLKATRPRGQYMAAEIFVPHTYVWLPLSPPRRSSRADATPRPEPPGPLTESLSFALLNPPHGAAGQAGAPASVSPKSPQSVLPLPPSNALARTLKLVPGALSMRSVAVTNTRDLTTDMLGSVLLPRLIENEAALAASLAALPVNRRLALPLVSIRVNEEWLAALPQTQEKLYFCFRAPQADSEVLAYSPATHSFALERPLQPLWQIRAAEQVPSLAALRSAAARRLGVPPGLLGLYTWHPPLLENALRMFVLERMEQLGVQLGPRDVVTVRLALGSSGLVMNLEPIRGGGSR